MEVLLSFCLFPALLLYLYSGQIGMLYLDISLGMTCLIWKCANANDHGWQFAWNIIVWNIVVYVLLILVYEGQVRPVLL